MISRGSMIAALIIRSQLQKEAKAKELLAGAGRGIKGVWEFGKRNIGEIASDAERSLARSGAPTTGKVIGKAIRWAPAAAGAGVGYHVFKPEVQNVKRRASSAVRAKLRQFEARSYQSSPYYSQGRYQ